MSYFLSNLTAIKAHTDYDLRLRQYGEFLNVEAWGVNGRYMASWRWHDIDGIAFTTETTVAHEIRGKGYGHIFRKLRCNIMRSIGISMELAWVNRGNVAQQRIMQASGARVIKTFTNAWHHVMDLYCTEFLANNELGEQRL